MQYLQKSEVKECIGCIAFLLRPSHQVKKVNYTDICDLFTYLQWTALSSRNVSGRPSTLVGFPFLRQPYSKQLWLADINGLIQTCLYWSAHVLVSTTTTTITTTTTTTTTTS